MSYLDQLRPASFRGIRFYVPDDDTALGRRVITHEYPGRDDPFHEDMGRAARVLNLTVYVGGGDFMERAAALEEALDQDGPGTLVHPHYGEVQVIVKSARRTHSAEAVGLVTFSIGFERYGKPRFPSATTDTAANLGTASTDLFGSLREEFLANFNSTGITDFVAEDSLGRINDMVSRTRGLFAQGGLSAAFPEFAALTSLDGGLVDNVIGLFQDIAATVRGKPQPVIGSAVANTAVSPKAVMKTLTSAATQSVDTAAVNASSNRQIIASNSTAVTNLFQGAAAASLAETARSADYESKEEALAIRGQATETLLALRDRYGDMGWDDSWKGAAGVIAALTRDVNDRIGRLPRTLRIRTAAVRPSIELAHRLYGDDPAALFGRADDLAARNNIRHPGFIPADELEVLINGQ